MTQMVALDAIIILPGKGMQCPEMIHIGLTSNSLDHCLTWGEKVVF